MHVFAAHLLLEWQVIACDTKQVTHSETPGVPHVCKLELRLNLICEITMFGTCYASYLHKQA